MKQLVPKNDKKRRKELNQKIDELESELKRTHEEELSEFNRANNLSTEKEDDKPVLEQLEQLQIGLESKQMSFESNQQSNKVSKAQKRRERKEREQLEREQRILEDEKDNENHVRTVEINKLDNLFKVGDHF